MERGCTQVQPPICKVCKMGHQSMLHNYNAKKPAGAAQGSIAAAGGSVERAQGASAAAAGQEETTTA